MTRHHANAPPPCPSGPLLFLLPLFAGLAGCMLAPQENVYGSGVRAEDERLVAEFTSLHIAAAAALDVRVGELTAVKLSCDDDLLDEIDTVVRGGELRIVAPDNLVFRAPLRVYVSTPKLARLEVEGSVDANLHGVSGENFELAVEGSSDVRADGKVERLELGIEGSGRLRLEELRAKHANVRIEGSGDVHMRAAYVLTYSIEGSGDILYLGNPSVAGDISGSGSVRRASRP